MTSTDATPTPGRVRVLVCEPVSQNLDGGRQLVERRDNISTPHKVVLEDAVAGNARRSRRLPFDPLHAPPAPAAHSPEVTDA